MKKLLIAAAIAAATATGAFAQDVVRIGTEGAYPPFNFKDADGTLKGFDVDIAKALCAKMEVTCEFVTQDWDGIIPALQANKYDAIIASMSITDERKKQVDFTDKYYNTPPAIVVAADSDLVIENGDTSPLAGKTIGAQSSTTHANYAEQKIEGATVKLYPTPAEAQADLEAGRIDAIIDDVVVGDEYVKKSGGKAKLAGTLTPDPVINGAGAGIAIRKGETELRDKFNAAIKAIREDGTYEKVQSDYFTFDVYGG